MNSDPIWFGYYVIKEGEYLLLMVFIEGHD